MSERERKRRRWDEAADGASPPPNPGAPHLTPVQALAAQIASTPVSVQEAAARAAREAAARINEQLTTGTKSQPPTPSGMLVGVSKPHQLKETMAPAGPVQQEFPINNYPPHLRFLLTKGDNHRSIAHETGASVTNKGKYCPPGQDPGDEKPLYLLVSGPTEEAVEKALDKLRGIVASHDGKSQRPEFGGARPARMVSYRVWMGMLPIEGFDVFAKIRGPEDAYLKHIEKETGALLSIRGRGSGFKDPETNEESPENLHIFVQAPNHTILDSAKALASNLVATTRKQYDEYRASKMPKPPPRPPMPPMPYGAYPPPYGMYPGGYGYPSYPGYPPAPYGAAPGAPGAAAPGAPGAAADGAASTSSPPAAAAAAGGAAPAAGAAAYSQYYSQYPQYAAYQQAYPGYQWPAGYGQAAAGGDAGQQQAADGAGSSAGGAGGAGGS